MSFPQGRKFVPISKYRAQAYPNDIARIRALRRAMRE
ncbi:hypothetical protein GSH05_17820 [Burkholderia pseudomallei]|nr:hypothetical protein CXQ84_17390 [Burkholderia pseudomallei]EDU09208.1 conserved hypothetical protein [Burkholderia pseudomallei 1655]KGX51149.1 hypothetical protein Y024_5766 [Burkholderia pseudomallei TSV44]AYX27058.1 hypothetical protein EGY16_01815 [Burkholderia pseudomallei]KAA8769448.1 hypothetical protein F5D26_07880 [Burkholderia pseudomallei]